MSYTQISNQQSAIGNRLWLMVSILLIATAFRFMAADSAPPGWRDDELIEYNMDRRIADGWRPLFITEAEGHEPVYHYLHAATIVLFGDNLIGYKWLPMAFGLLTIALTYALARKMFGPKAAHPSTASSLRSESAQDASRLDLGGHVALITAALMAVSFWPVMYSRFGVRHIGTLPWMLAAMYVLYPPRMNSRADSGNTLKRVAKNLFAAVCLAAGLMTYFAGRAVPIILAGFLGYLLIFQRSMLKRVWWRYATAIAIGVLIAAPMFVEIANTPGAEKRTEVVGGPQIELRKGNLQPAIETTLGTLGMFTFAGDPESLYNVPNRPVFDWITGVFFYLGVLVCLVRLKRVESGFALAWLVIGIAPAFVSVPAASFSHTIAALPVVYIVAAIGVVTISDKMTRGHDDKMTSHQQISVSPLHLVILSGIVLLNGWLTLRDYFGTWANDDFVRFQYHAPTRAVAKWLDENPQIVDVAIGTNLNELTLDPLALRLDLKRDDVKARWFTPETALLYLWPRVNQVILLSVQPAGGETKADLAACETLHADQVQLFDVCTTREFSGGVIANFEGVLDLFGWQRVKFTPVHPGERMGYKLWWIVRDSYSGPGLKSFVHLLDAQGQVIVGDDRLDVNLSTLFPGDVIQQISTLLIPPDLAPGSYQVEVGLYNPETGARTQLADGSDRYLLYPLDVAAP